MVETWIERREIDEGKREGRERGRERERERERERDVGYSIHCTTSTVDGTKVQIFTPVALTFLRSMAAYSSKHYL